MALLAAPAALAAVPRLASAPRARLRTAGASAAHAGAVRIAARRPALCVRAPRRVSCAAGAAAAPLPEEDAPADAAPAAAATPAAAPADASVLARVKGFFGGAKLDRAKLAALGTSALLAYGFVSNVNAVTLLIVSWVSFAKSTGLSPLAPGQWKAYLLAYTALYAVIGNGLRPVRFSLSVAITPAFDRFVALLQRRFNVAKPVAFGMCVFLVNVCGTCTYLALGLRVVTAVLGLPLLP